MRNDVDSIIRDVLVFRLEQLEKASDRDVLVCYGPIVSGVDHAVREALEVIPTRNPSGKLLVVLNTPGGVVEVVERMVETIRFHYTDVAVLIPDQAMSAGTIFAMAADSILMDHFSRLGPIDPQLARKDGTLIPALGYLLQWERIKQLDRDGKLTAPELMLAQKLDLAELHDFEQAAKLSVTLLKKWLTAYKFKDWTVTRTQKTPVTPKMKADRAEEIAKALQDVTRWHSHGRGISRETLEADLNLIVDKVEDHPQLATPASAYHDCLTDFLRKNSASNWVQTRSYV